ncbi:hypothetical protein GQ457_17G020530 [Hibiscus cannabinus]
MKEIEAMSHVPICKCGKETMLKTAWSDDNPRRRFYGCSNYGNRFQKSCNFFRWYEPPMDPRAKVLLVGLLRKIRANDRERRNERFAWVFVVICSILVTAIWMDMK